MTEHDLLGRPLDDIEREVLDVYERLKTLAGRSDTAPCVASNARFALASVWQIVNDLNLKHEQLDDLGV